MILYFSDLTKEAQEMLLAEVEAKSPEEMSWDIFPIGEITLAEKKVQNLTIEEAKKKIEEFFLRNEYIVLAQLFKRVEELTGRKCDDVDYLWELENNMAFGFDCGWCYINEYDTGKEIYMREFPYNTQSVTLKRIQLQYALDELQLNDAYFITTRLD